MVKIVCLWQQFIGPLNTEVRGLCEQNIWRGIRFQLRAQSYECPPPLQWHKKGKCYILWRQGVTDVYSLTGGKPPLFVLGGFFCTSESTGATLTQDDGSGQGRKLWFRSYCCFQIHSLFWSAHPVASILPSFPFHLPNQLTYLSRSFWICQHIWKVSNTLLEYCLQLP